jgi:hypothetical protein
MKHRPGKPVLSVVPAVVVAGLCAAFAGAVRADSTRFGLDAEYNHLTNVNRAAIDDEAQSDNTLALEGYAARSFLLSDRSGIVVRGGVKVREFFEFDDLSSLGLAVRAAWRYQPTPGFTNLWIELAAGGEAFKFRDSDIRDGGLANVSASIGRYLTDRLRAESGAGYERRFAAVGEVFDLANGRLWGSLDYKLTTSATLYGSATWMKGDQVSTLFNTASWGNLYTYAGASAADPAFASAFGSAPTAYRFKATTYLLDLGANVAITGSQAVDIGAGFFRSEADDGDGSYDGASVRVAYLVRFR